jgi:hypothetical protein
VRRVGDGRDHAARHDGLLPGDVRGLERVYAGRAKWEEMMVSDPELGYRPKPGLDMLYPSEGRNIVVRTTAHGLGDIGFRDIDTKPPFDAIALGDSFTFCDDVRSKPAGCAFWANAPGCRLRRSPSAVSRRSRSNGS